MEETNAIDLVAVLTSVSNYGSQLAAVFHNYSLIADEIPCGFEGSINILDATITIIRQILTLLRHDVHLDDVDDGKPLFSEGGLKYVRLLSIESAICLTGIEPAIDEACLDRKDWKALQKQKRKIFADRMVTVLDPLSLNLDEKDFLERLERVKWSWAMKDINDGMERLYELQLHLLLLFQVVSVCDLTRNLSSGKVDIQSVVAYHRRITRTANFVGIRGPESTTTRRGKYGRRRSFSGSGSDFDIDTDSDSSFSSRPKFGKKGYNSCSFPPPPPPPLPAVPGLRMYTSPPPTIPVKEPIVPSTLPKVPTVENAKPPAYSESRKSTGNDTPALANESTLLGTMTDSGSAVSPNPDQKPAAVTAVYPPEKSEEQMSDLTEMKKVKEPATLEAQLFKSKPAGLRFKLKTLFRSKESLAEEMRRTLRDSESQLTAYIIQRHMTRQVPHSAFHSLETTHMRTILSQLRDDTWYKTFSTLDNPEHCALDRIVRPSLNIRAYDRELVVLKVLQQNKLNEWMVLISELLRNQPFPRGATGRVILAICREKLVDGRPLMDGPYAVGPPPPGPGSAAPFLKVNRLAIRVPPMSYIPPSGTRVSNLKIPPRPTPYARPVSMDQPWQSGLPPPPPAPGRLSNDLKLATNDLEAMTVLTSFNEYTLRPCDGGDWSRISITQESAEPHLIKQRVQHFEARDGNVLETKLRMTIDQATQVNRLMDELRAGDRDFKFEWCWAEISLHNDAGEIADFVPRGSILATATLMHLVAKRMLRPQYKPLEVYNSLMKASPGPRPGPPGPPPGPVNPIIVHPSGIIKLPKDKKKIGKHYSNDSDLYSFYSSSYSSSDDESVGHVRRRLRRYKERKERRIATENTRRSGPGKYYNSDGDSDSGSDTEETDIIRIDLELKKGDDVVKKLLELWTANSDSQGKGKDTTL